MQWCVHSGDHGLCECTIVNSPPGLPGPAGDRGDAGMTGEFGQEGDLGEPGPQGDNGFPVRTIESSPFCLFCCSFLGHSLFPYTLLCCLAGTSWAQWCAGPKRSERRTKCGLTER